MKKNRKSLQHKRMHGRIPIPRRTVRKRIFFSNTLMVVLTLVIFLAVNFFAIRTYMGSVEREFRASAERVARRDREERDGHSGGSREDPGMDEEDMGDFVEQWTVERDEFYLVFAIGGVICIASLVGISQLFTRNLTRHIMKPLDALSEGTERIRDNNLTQDIQYHGDQEFENVCIAFNEMQASIREGQEKNRKYEKARTDMIAGISHDLRTPLTAIRGSIKGLMDGVAQTPEMQQKFLETAYRRTGDMDVLLSQLLYLSRMETGNVPLEMQTIAIEPFLEQYVTDKQDFLDPEKEEIYFHSDFAAEGKEKTEVRIDPDQFRRILDNLLENSRKYAETVPLVIDLYLGLAPKDNYFHEQDIGVVSIVFHDNGVGVPEEKLPHVFEEFYRGDESRNRKKGNGLGLYIVKYLMEAMGGKVRAENNQGFEVILELPLAISFPDVLSDTEAG